MTSKCPPRIPPRFSPPARRRRASKVSWQDSQAAKTRTVNHQKRPTMGLPCVMTTTPRRSLHLRPFLSSSAAPTALPIIHAHHPRALSRPLAVRAHRRCPRPGRCSRVSRGSRRRWRLQGARADGRAGIVMDWRKARGDFLETDRTLISTPRRVSETVFEFACIFGTRYSVYITILISERFARCM